MDHSGSRFGIYEIVEIIGAGGMGQVYRARDTKLGRDVAIKVLPEDFARDEARRQRFEREAKLLASVNHPAVATLHGFEEVDGIQFLVMELVEGETLLARLARGPLPAKDAIALFVTLAEGLVAAHAKGVVHRDFKPGNIQLTRDGGIKILDFGLAKDVSRSAPADLDLSDSPTLTKNTVLGTIMGTPSYMSPEQARGETVDERTDVWAFVCVLFETLTGTKAFDGKTLSDVVAAVLANEPDWARLDAGLPSRVRDLMLRSLRKDSRERVSSMSAVRLDLADGLREGAHVEPARTAAGARWIPVALSAVALVASIFIWSSSGQVETGGEVSRFTIELPRDRTLRSAGPRHMALSSDGRQLVYAGVENGKNQLYLRTMDTVEERRLAGTENADNPSFSFDGRELLFDTSAGTLQRLDLAGGQPMRLADGVVGGGGFSPTGAVVFSRGNSLWTSSAEGGTPEKLYSIESTEFPLWAEFLPSGDAVLYSRWGDYENNSVHVFMLRTGETKKLLDNAIAASFVDSGHLVFLDISQRALSAVTFDAENIQVTGPRVRINERVEHAVNGAISFAVSRNGNLAYRSGGEASLLVWVDRSGRATPEDSDARLYNRPRLSPDGSHIAVAVTDERGRDIWIREIASRSFSKLTFDEADDSTPVWSPDGTVVAFSSQRSGVWMTYAKPADGTGDSRLLIDRQGMSPSGFSPDGNVIAFGSDFGSPGFLRLNPEPEIEEIDLPGQGHGTVFSPNGRFVAYASNESGSWEVLVKPFPSLSGKWQVSTEGGTEPVWARDGKELFYRHGAQMISVPVSTSDAFSFGRPRLLFEGNYRLDHAGQFANYDVSPDGKSFLMIQPDPEARSEITVVLNWAKELKRLAPAN